MFLFLAVRKTTPTFDKLLTSNLLAENQFYDRSCHWTRCCCDPGGKKNIAIFAYKQCQNIFEVFSKCQSVQNVFKMSKGLKCFQSVFKIWNSRFPALVRLSDIFLVPCSRELRKPDRRRRGRRDHDQLTSLYLKVYSAISKMV